MAQSTCEHLLDLPDEILISIFNDLDLNSLLQSVRVCKQVRGFAEPFLYGSINVLDGDQGAALSRNFLANPCRATWVRSFLISTKYGQDSGLVGLPPFIAQMSNLHHLRLETPDCNLKEPDERVGWVALQDRYERIFEGASTLQPDAVTRHLPNLKSCTMHFVDEVKAIYPMTRYSMLFLHPNLRSLTVSCTSTHWPKNLWEYFRKDPTLVNSTRLEHLHLEECDIDPETLAILLSFPRELKSLKISEGIRYDTRFRESDSRNNRMHGNVCPAALTDAITQNCGESLESLSLSLGHFRRRGQYIYQYGQHLDLTALKKLKHLELDVRTINLIRTRPNCDHALGRRLPPCLESLRIFAIPLGQEAHFETTRKAYFPFDICLTKDKAAHGVPNLRHLTYCYEYVRVDEQILEDEEDYEELSHLRAQARLVGDSVKHLPTYKAGGIRLGIEITILPNGYIPPYLYPEDQPTTHLIWESH